MGLENRSSRPHQSPGRLPAERVATLAALRRMRLSGRGIAFSLFLPFVCSAQGTQAVGPEQAVPVGARAAGGAARAPSTWRHGVSGHQAAGPPHHRGTVPNVSAGLAGASARLRGAPRLTLLPDEKAIATPASCSAPLVGLQGTAERGVCLPAWLHGYNPSPGFAHKPGATIPSGQGKVFCKRSAGWRRVRVQPSVAR